MGLALDEPVEKEEIARINGLDVLIAEEAKDLVEEGELDYADSPYGKSFTIKTGAGGDCSGDCEE